MSETKESDYSDQSEYERALTESYNTLLKTDFETSYIGDFLDEFVRTFCLEDDSNEVFRSFLRSKDEYKQLKASSSVFSDLQTTLEASKKDTALSIETRPEEDINSLIIKYFEMVEEMKYFESLRLAKEKEIETEEPKKEDCSKDCASSKDTQTKAFSSSENDLEVFIKNKRKTLKLLILLKISLLIKVDKSRRELLEMLRQDRQKLNHLFQEIMRIYSKTAM